MNSNITKLTRTALLIAISIVLSRFLSIQTPIAKIGFSFVPLAVIGMLYGPAWAALGAAVADYIGATLFPVGAYFPGFTVTAALAGGTYGFFLQKDGAKSIVKVIAAAVVVNICWHLCLNTLWLQMITGKGYLALLPARIMSNALMVPVQAVCIKFVYEVMKKQLGKLNYVI